MSETSQSTTETAGSPASTPDGKTATETKQNGSVSFLNESETTKETPKDPKATSSEAKEPPKAEGAPEKYSDFTLPDGFEANETVMNEAKGLFKELNLPQTAGQKLIDLYSKVSQDASSAPYQAWLDMQKTWKDGLKADPDIGGKLPEVRRSIAQMIDGIGNAELSMQFREAMDVTGAGNNLAFVKMMHHLSELLTEGRPLAGSKPPTKEHKSAAQTFYPNLPSQAG